MSMFTKMVRKYVPQAKGKSLSLTTGINKAVSFSSSFIDDVLLSVGGNTEIDLPIFVMKSLF